MEQFRSKTPSSVSGIRLSVGSVDEAYIIDLSKCSTDVNANDATEKSGDLEQRRALSLPPQRLHQS